MDKVIQVENLRKSYGKIEAVKGISFYVEQGKLFSFLGPNGAGKSTSIDILCTLLQKDEGTIKIGGYELGKDDDLIRRQIGVVFQDSVLDDLLSIRENLIIRGKFYGLKGHKLKAAVENAADATDISDILDRPYGKLSGGQRRRADIARALVNTPRILFLDEPTTGLDPKSKDGIWKMIEKIQKETKMTVFLTTHYMEEAAQSDYILILNHGKIAVRGTPYDLKEKYSQDTLRIKTRDKEALEEFLKTYAMDYKEKKNLIIVNLKNSRDAISLLEKMNPWIESFEVIQGSMEDVFLNVIEGGLSND